MAEVSIPVVGATYTNRSLDVGSQVTQNFYVEANPQSTEPVSLNPFFGLKLFSTAGAGKNRNSLVHKGVYYTISGSELYSVTNVGTATLIGSIGGSSRCGMETDGNNLIITNGVGKPYTYDGTTLTQGTDADLPNAASVTYLNRRVIYDGSDQDIAFADLDAPLSVNSLNVAKEESKPDDTLAVKAYRQQVFVFGGRSLAPWYPSTGNPPYTRVSNSVQEIGTSALYSIAVNTRYMYFLGNDLIPYRIDGLAAQPLGTPAICQEIRGYADVSDAFGVTFSFDSLNFYMLSFPSANATWLFNEQSLLWTNLAYGTDGDQHLISSHQFVYGRHLVADRRNGNIYELDSETYTDNGDVIQRRRDTVSISGRTFGKPGSEVFMNWIEVDIEPGVSLVTDNAVMILQFSDDNGKSWSSELWSEIGEQGDYGYKIRWEGMGSFYNRMFRFTMSDPVKWVLIAAFADVELGI